MHKHLIPVVILCFTTLPSGATAREGPALHAIADTLAEGQLSIDALVAESLHNNPQLRAARHQSAASQTKVNQATSWDAPQVGVEFFQTPIQSFPNPARNWMENDYFIQQMIPFPGKLSAMEDAAVSNANMAEQASRSLERKIIRDLKSACYELYLVQRKTRVNAENQALMKRFVDIARKQYEVGMGSHHDILRAQTELSTLLNDGIILQQEQRVAESMINTILSRPANAPVGTMPDIETQIPGWTYEQLRPLALESRAELKAMSHNVGMNKSELSLSRREYVPDLMVRFMYKDMAQTDDDHWAAMVGVNIPLTFWSGGKFTSRVEENELNVKRAEEEYSSMSNMVLFELQDALVKVQTNHSRVQLYKSTVIPQAEQTLESTTAAYQTGKTEFLMLIDAYRMLLMARLEYYMAVMSYMASQAQLEQAVGLDIAEIEKRIH